MVVVTQIPFLRIVPVAAIVAIVLAFYFKNLVTKADPGNEDMKTVQGYIKAGANAFIKRQYITLGIVVAVLAVVIALVYMGHAGIPWYLMM